VTVPAGDTVVHGTVQSVSGDDIVITTGDGSTATVVVSSSTTYAGPDGADLSSVTAGLLIQVVGTTSGSVVDATEVLICPAPSTGGQDSGTGGSSGGSTGTGSTGTGSQGGGADQGGAQGAPSPGGGSQNGPSGGRAPVGGPGGGGPAPAGR